MDDRDLIKMEQQKDFFCHFWKLISSKSRTQCSWYFYENSHYNYLLQRYFKGR